MRAEVGPYHWSWILAARKDRSSPLSVSASLTRPRIAVGYREPQASDGACLLSLNGFMQLEVGDLRAGYPRLGAIRGVLPLPKDVRTAIICVQALP